MSNQELSEELQKPGFWFLLWAIDMYIVNMDESVFWKIKKVLQLSMPFKKF